MSSEYTAKTAPAQTITICLLLLTVDAILLLTWSLAAREGAVVAKVEFRSGGPGTLTLLFLRSGLVKGFS